MHRLNGLRILIVEDDLHIAEMHQGILQDAGAQVVGPVPSARAALDRIDQGRIDIALLDVNLGSGGNGCQVAAALRSRGLPFIVLSGYDGGLIPELMKGAPCLQKIYRPEDLYDAIERSIQLQKTG